MKIGLAAISTALVVLAQSPSQYKNQGFGVMYSQGLAVYCCNGDERAAIPSPNAFNPTALNLDQWLSVAKQGGAHYVVLTAKYHMGFALWPRTFAVSGFPPFDIRQSSWYAAHGNFDVTGNFISKARALGLNVGLYFSVWDRNFEAQCGCNPGTNPLAYLTMVESDLHDLLTNYGPISSLWLDGWYWQVGYTAIPFSTLAAYVHSLQPNCLVLDNNHLHPSPAGVDLYEFAIDGAPLVGNLVPAEVNYSLQRTGTNAPDYSYVATDAGLHFNPLTLAADWALSNSRFASWLINFGPDTTGLLPADQVKTFQQMIGTRLLPPSHF